MAKKEMETPTVSEVSETKKFPLSVLRDNCTKLFGVTSSTFAGATVGLSDGEYTIADMNNKIKVWLKKEVK
ncbi:MAG: hypothetical protein PHN80_06105 [Hespellia sp.]|nr:hypothetical protein [Hespellia sp.]